MHPETGLVFPVPSDVIRQRMMVAEFVARQQSGSPVNGETPNMNGGNGGHNTNGTQNISSPSPGTPFLHDQHSHHGHHSTIMLGQSPLSPHCSNSQDDFSNNYDLAAHLKRKDLFTQRKQREFIPDNKKDDSYWDRRRRNNEAAKRSREKRRYNDMVLEQRVVELTKENYVLKAQLEAIKDKYNICGENLVSIDQVMATFPSNEQVLSITKRAKLSSSNSNSSTTGVLSPQNLMYPQTPSPVPTSVIHKPILLNDVDTYSSSGSPINHQHHNTNSSSHNYNSNRQSPPISTALQQTNTNPIEHPSLDRLDQYAVVTTPPHHQNHLHHHHYTPYQNHHPHHHHELITQYVDTTVNGTNNGNAAPHDDEDSVLNLSRRGVGAASPYEISSGTGSGAASGDDEQCENQQQLNDTNNSLPLKLRHKSHLGDKDAATALLALQHIKQEPNSRASPPSWDGEGSSDERDSGISICTAEWTLPRKITPTAQPDDTDDVCLESKLAKLESEVASIKNMMILKTAGTGSTAAAQ